MEKSEGIVINIPLTEIHASKDFNCRGSIAPIDVIHLADSFKSDGQLQPVIVAPYSIDKIKETGFKYLLIAGYHRHMAATILEWETIEAKILSEELSDRDAIFMNLNENLQRKNLTFMQEARAIKKVTSDLFDVTESMVMKRLGQSRGWVQVRMMALKLPKVIQAEIDAGIVTQTDVRDLHTIQINGNDQDVLAATKILKEAKEKGKKGVRVEKPKSKKDVLSKKHRRRPEIFNMMEHICTSEIGNFIGSRCLAWAAGEISALDLYSALKDYAEAEGLNYTRPNIDTDFNTP